MLFAQSEHYQQYDPFLKSKLETFRSSEAGVYALAKLLQRALDSKDPHQAFLELGQAQLWGNATVREFGPARPVLCAQDLSLLTNLSQADITRLQSGSADKGARPY